MNAPFCPVSRDQTNLPRGLLTRLPSIPLATDLPSLIRAVNIMRDILRSLTTSLTVNNTFIAKSGRPPRLYGKVTYQFSPYPDWYQRSGDTSTGYVYYKSKSGKDPEQRAYVDRINQVVYRNNERDNDNNFYWTYYVPLDSEEGDSGAASPFQEDFFERVVNVKWSDGLAVEFEPGNK